MIHAYKNKNNNNNNNNNLIFYLVFFNFSTMIVSGGAYL